MNRGVATKVALVGAVVFGAAACARNERPSGGPEDRFPPYVIETLPDTFSTVEPGTREVRFRFSERISERPVSGRLNDAVVVSPSTGEVRVKHSRDGITVRIREGFAPGLVYRVTVLPVIKDMFGNALQDPFDLVFSTGGEIVPNVVAGMVEDRVTGEATRDARVAARFVLGDDTVTHWNVSDTGGVFSLRYVPAGTFEVWAWQDMNRDGEVGGSEPQTAFVPGELVEAPDTTLAILTLILPDTTPPRLARATVEDSVKLKIEIDDYIEPDLEEGAIAGVVTVVALDTASAEEDSLGTEEDTAGVTGVAEAGVEAGDTATAAGEAGDTLAEQEAGEPEEETDAPEPVPLPEVGDTIPIRIFQEHEYKVWLALRQDSIAQAREDSIARAREAAEAGDTGDAAAGAQGAGAVGEAAVPGIRGAAPAGREARNGPGAGEDSDTADAPDLPRTLSGLLKPARSLVGVLEEALMDRVVYELVVDGVVNIAGVPGGGGVDTLTWEPPVVEKDSAVAADSAQTGDSLQAGDSAQAGDTMQAGDTTGVPPDTTQAGDTTGVPPDTTQAGDTTGVPPDTTEAADTTEVPPDTTQTGDTTKVPPDTTGNMADPNRPALAAARRRTPSPPVDFPTAPPPARTPPPPTRRGRAP